MPLTFRGSHLATWQTGADTFRTLELLGRIDLGHGFVIHVLTPLSSFLFFFEERHGNVEMASLQVWTRANVSANPTCPRQGAEDLLLYYDFKTQSCSDILVDRSGNGFDGRRYGGAAWRQLTDLAEICPSNDTASVVPYSVTPTCASGAPNALSLDGEISRVSVPAIRGGPFAIVTLETWLRFEVVDGEQVTRKSTGIEAGCVARGNLPLFRSSYFVRFLSPTVILELYMSHYVVSRRVSSCSFLPFFFSLLHSVWCCLCLQLPSGLCLVFYVVRFAL